MPIEIAFNKQVETGFGIKGVQLLYAFPVLRLFEGQTRVTLSLSLPRNALVQRSVVQVQAQRVESVGVLDVAQARSYSDGGAHELVIDFGTPRTVSGLSMPSACKIKSVHGWLGSQFNTVSALRRPWVAASSASFPELRTERLRVVVTQALSADDLENAVILQLPEPPSGLKLSIDGAAPIWQHPEPVRADSAQVAVNDGSWNKDSKRLVDITQALAALTGDPTASDDAVSFQLTLETAVPCALGLTLEGHLQTRRIRRMRFAGETTTAIDFDSEGSVDLPLPVPATGTGTVRRIDELRWVAEADLGPRRTVPALGPDALPGEAGLPRAEALVTPQIAACARLPAGSGIETLQAIRLPLTAGPDGAEARLVLWSPGDPASGGLPAEPLPQGSSEPVTLDAGRAESWVSFDFRKPPLLATAAQAPMPWVAVLASRGSLSWALANSTGVAAAATDQQVLRRGPPAGPWKALPSPLQSRDQVIDARARLRLQGLSAKGAPLAPLSLALLQQTQSVDLWPTPAGAPGRLTMASGLLSSAPTLRIVSRVAGRLLLRDIDVLSDI